MSKDTKDALDRSQDAADTLYDRDHAAPLPAPAGGALHTYDPAIGVIDQRGAELWERTGMDSAAREAFAEKHRRIAKVTGLPDSVRMLIVDADIDNELAAVRIAEDPDAEQLAEDLQIDANNAELRDRFSKRHGQRDGEALLERTRRFVRQSPELQRILQTRGVGSRVDLVEAIAAHVFSSGWR